jgi:hypothetical protein
MSCSNPFQGKSAPLPIVGYTVGKDLLESALSGIPWAGEGISTQGLTTSQGGPCLVLLHMELERPELLCSIEDHAEGPVSSEFL